MQRSLNYSISGSMITWVLTHNHSVRDQVRFIGYFLANSRNDNDLITFGELVEFQFLSNISLEENEELEEVLEEEDASAD